MTTVPLKWSLRAPGAGESRLGERNSGVNDRVDRVRLETGGLAYLALRMMFGFIGDEEGDEDG